MHLVSSKFRFFLESSDRTLIIMRGVSGTGKSTRARELVGPHGALFSSDEYFEPDYKANWSREKIGEAHRWNFERASKAMQQGVSPIIIDNTNIKPYEAKNYIIEGQKYGYEIRFEEPQSDHWKQIQGLSKQIDDLSQQLASKNLHGASPATVRGMITHYRPYSIDDALNSIAPWEQNNETQMDS